MSLLRCSMTALLLALATTGPAGAAPQGGQPPEPAVPLFHGNWCGTGDANRATPVDAFDTACRAHDLCYEKVGRGACSCDKAFLKATAALVKSPRTDEAVRSKAATANSFFSATPCVDPSKNSRSAGKR